MAAKKKRVLAVDDDPTALNALRQILTQKGYDVTTAASGEEALSLVASQDFDLALLDVVMPGTSGYDVCRQIRADERTKDLPVVFLTAKGAVADMREGQGAGSDLYLVKPVMAARLLAMLGMFLSDEIPLGRKRR
jgi:DNA-binding response OmpR family regulator